MSFYNENKGFSYAIPPRTAQLHDNKRIFREEFPKTENLPEKSYAPLNPDEADLTERQQTTTELYEVKDVKNLPLPETSDDICETAGFLRTQIGKLMRIEFLLGNQTREKTGKLLKSDPGYILIQETGNNNTTMCDASTVKFVTILDGEKPEAVLL